ncbi:PTS sugar transporter subunit IIA [Pontiella agarivorans]|uniref:PTS sugar transporter subunit IIA n=1 Tax=Pontiella agarivorans TaxID=3038953 RepID=A0ABU5MSH3_9BACT|nr:PTS sugar transporter subunit IIA [Pontiella agarivorans]MDZ8117143.1 PTS sugar transporter subunit IIA [Pontiella agarivorans]
MEALQQIFDSILHNSGHLSPFLVVGILILAGFTGDFFGKFLKLPHVTGNILGGIIIGPTCMGLIGTHEQLDDLQPIATFAMSLVAVSIGGHLSYRRIHNSLRRIISISVFEVTFSVITVICAGKIFGMDWPTTLLLGGIAASTAPATTIALIRESRAKGPFVKTLISAVALNNILCILIFVMMRTFVSAYFESGETIGKIDDALILSGYHLLGAVVLGLGMGWMTKFLVSKPKFHDFTTILLAIMLLDGLAAYLTLSPLLVCLFFGVYLGNSSEVAEKQLGTLTPLEPTLYVIFFTLAGVSLHLDALLAVGLVAMVYIGSRMLGKTLGAAIGGMVGKCSKRMWTNMSYALYPQSGIAIGLVVLLSDDGFVPEDIKQAVGAIVLAGVTVAEIIGPFATKAALARSGEANRDRQRLVEFLAEEFIMINLRALDKWDAIRQMVAFLMKTHRVEHMSQDELYQSVVAREKEMSTAMGKGIAIPHGHIEKGPAIQGVMAICREGLEFDAPDDGPVKLIMLIITPKDKKDMHLKVLSSLSSMISDDAIRDRLISAMSPEDAMEVIESKEARDYNYFLE